MSTDKLKRLHELEETITKLKELRVRTSERLSLLRQQRDQYIEELKKLGVDPKAIKEKIAEMNTEIDAEITAIEAQIPLNIKALLKDDNT